MSCQECYEWVKTFVKRSAINSAFVTQGTNANKFLRTLAEAFCRAKTNTIYTKDAINLVLQDNFEDSDKVKIFENVLSQKEQEFNLYKSNIFTVPNDLISRLELLRLVEALSRDKIKSIADVKKVLSFLGINNVEFRFKNINQTETLGNLVLMLWGSTAYENDNTWKIYLPANLLLDNIKRQTIETFIVLLKQPHHNYKFYYTL